MYMVWGCTTFILNFFLGGGKQRQEQRTAPIVFTQGDENESGQCVYCGGNARVSQLCLVWIFFMYVLCMYCLKTYEEEKNHFVFH
jgi:hypothetical protein